MALRQEHGFTYGILANQIWSFAGWGPQNVNATYLQPFVSYTTKTYTTFGMNTESTYNWQADQWTVPMNFTVQQLVKIGKHARRLPGGLPLLRRKTQRRPGLGFALHRHVPVPEINF